MKFEIEKNKILDILQRVVKLPTKHLTLPVLSCIYLEINNDGYLNIKSTNLDIGVEFKLKLKNSTMGSLAVPANTLINTISNIKEDKITFDSLGENLKISTTKNSATIKCMPKEDFPSIPKINNENLIKLNIKDFIFGLRSVWYAASISNIKQELSSIYIHKNNDQMVFAATDSFRLAEKRIHFKSKGDFPSILIPFKNISEIIKIFDGYNEEIDVFFDKNQIAFVKEEIYLISRLIDGSFPDYNQIIPKEYKTKVTLLKNDLINAIKSASIFSDSMNQIKLKIENNSKSLQIQSKNNDVGEYNESIKASIEGDDVELNFNSKFINDCFQSIFSDSITLKFNGLGKPLIINGISDSSFTYILMPMNR